MRMLFMISPVIMTSLSLTHWNPEAEGITEHPEIKYGDIARRELVMSGTNWALATSRTPFSKGITAVPKPSTFRVVPLAV